MFSITLVSENLTLSATMEDGSRYYRGTITDSDTKIQAEVRFTSNEMASILALTVHHDGMPPGVDEHYAVAEPAMERHNMGIDGHNVDLRLIP